MPMIGMTTNAPAGTRISTCTAAAARINFGIGNI
jgi:hypothetical protein